MLGGKVLGSGAMGCIFKPALPCSGETTRPDGYVSKLLTRTSARKEYNEILKIKEAVTKIKDHSKYYIIGGIRHCAPEAVTKEDLEDYDTKCTALKINSGYSKRKIQSIAKTGLGQLQLPDGGMDLFYYFKRKEFSDELFHRINTAMVKLLKDGIATLKKVKVIHQDIKGDNIVYSEKENLARLIDWGLSSVSTGKNIPKILKGRPLSFNVPFTNIILQTSYQEQVGNVIIINVYENIISKPEIKKLIETYNGKDLIGFLKPHISELLQKEVFFDSKSLESVSGDPGHLDFITNILEMCGEFDSKKLPEHHPKFSLLSSILSEQISSVLLHFSVKNNKMGKFSDIEFFEKVFKKNCDIFGFLSCYITIFMNKNTPKPLRQSIYDTIIKPFYLENKYAYTPFDVSKIADACIQLNNVSLGSKAAARIATTPKTPVSLKASSKATLKESPRSSVKLTAKASPAENIFSWPADKRCPKGSQRDKKTRKCVKKTEKVKKSEKVKKTVKKVKSVNQNVFSWPADKRCPKGSRRDKKTKKCVKTK